MTRCRLPSPGARPALGAWCCVLAIVTAPWLALLGNAAVAQDVDANDDAYETQADVPLQVGPPGVLANDELDIDDDDGGGGGLSAALIQDVDSGTLTLTPNGSFRYVPAPGFTGEVEFEYRAVFRLFWWDEAEVTITVTVPEIAPTVGAIPDQTATENVPFSLALAPFVTDPDTPPEELEFTALDPLPPGLELDAGGGLSGVPELGRAAGRHAIRFTVSDGNASAEGALNLTILEGERVDLVTSASVSPNPVAVDETAAWTFEIVNDGEATAGSVALDGSFTRLAPFGFDVPEDPACSLTEAADQVRLECALGALRAGESRTVRVTGRGSGPGDVHASATASLADGPAPDTNPDNDTATVTLSVAGSVGDGPAQRISGLAARAVAAGDLDGDGRADLAVATEAARSVLVLFARPDPSNADKLVLAEPPAGIGSAALDNDVAVADLDGDSDLDVVAAGASGVANRVFLNDGAGTFEVVPVGGTDTDARAVATGDVDGDGFVDLVFANAGPSTIHHGGGSPGSYAPAVTLDDVAATDVVVVDLFGDAALELVLAAAEGDAQIYTGSGGTYAPAASLPTGPATAVAAADFNNDGAVDLVFGHAAPATDPGTSAVFLNTSGTAPSFQRSAPLGAAPVAAVIAGDTDLDDDADIVVLSPTGAHRVFRNSDGAFTVHPQQPTTDGARGGVLAPLSVDERVDLAVAGPNGLSVFYNDGNGNLGLGDTGAPTIALVGEAEVSVQTGTDWADPGATATDAVDGDLSDAVVSDADVVDTGVVGTYVVSYNVTDASGNAADTVTRDVRVQAQETTGGGGGGALGVLELIACAALGAARRAARARRPAAGRTRVRRPLLRRLAALVCAALPAGLASASELGYTYVDFGAVRTTAGAVGVQSPTALQSVAVRPSRGDGMNVGGSLAIGRRFYAATSFASSVVDVEATVTSPLEATTATGNFDLIQTRVAFGYIHEYAENLDLVGELSYDSVEYDFGSFAGESFDLDDGGAGVEVGVRWNPQPKLELHVAGRFTSVGKADLSTGRFDSETALRAGMRWSFFEGLALGIDYRGGQLEALGVSLRFGFGDLRWASE